MTTTLQRIGDEWGLVLDQEILDELGIDENAEFLVAVGDDGIFLKPIRFASDGQVDRLTGKIMTDHAETLRKLAL